MSLVGVADIEAARAALAGVARHTPLEASETISHIVGHEVVLKCENLQVTGSFKVRGAFHRLARLTDAEKAGGVVAASAGNHGQGVARAARMLGVSATVFMPVDAALPKVEATRSYGADVVFHGASFDDAESAAEKHAAETGRVFLHPFEHSDVIAGQGTVGLEILDDCPTAGIVVVPVGGGGLISGVAAAVKARRPECRVVGVQASGAASMVASRRAGRPTVAASTPTFCDGIAVKHPGDLTYAHVEAFVDDVVAVDDDVTARAVLLLLERAKLVVEPAGAVAVAALLARLAPGGDGPVVAVLSGGNVDPLLLDRIVRFGLTAAGRYLNVRTSVDDRPGELHRLLGIVAGEGANVLSVEHHRTGVAMPLPRVEVALSVETRDAAHAGAVTDRLTSEGYVLRGG